MSEIIKAFAYIRQSTDRQDMQLLSLNTQEREVKELITQAEKEWKVEIKVKYFIEKKSASKENREEFKKMMTKIDAGESQYIFSAHLDRLSRNPIDSGVLQNALLKKKILKIRTKDGTYTRKEAGILTGVLFGKALDDIINLTDRSADGTETLILAGGYPAKAPFGYINDKLAVNISDKIKVDEKAAHYILRSFEMRNQGAGYEEISNFLFSEGFKTKNGSRFATSTIETWMKNPFYYGVFKWGRYTQNHIYPTIIPKDLWKSVNEKRRKFKPRKENFILKGVVKSAHSGRVLTASLAKGKHIMYHTHTRYKGKEELVSINQNIIIDFFDKHIYLYDTPKEVKPFIMNAFRDYYKIQIEAIEKEKKAAQNELSKVSNRLKALCDMRLDGDISSQAFKLKQEELVDLQNEYTLRLKAATILDEDIMTKLSQAVELFTNLSTMRKSADIKTKCSIIRLIAVELYIDSDKKAYVKENEVFEGLRFLNQYCLEVPSGVEPLWRVLQTRAGPLGQGTKIFAKFQVKSYKVEGKKYG